MSSVTTSLPHKPRFNARILVFAAIAIVLIGWPVYTFVTYKGIEKNGDVYDVDLKAMSNYEMDQNAATLKDVPQEWRELDGKKVALEGQIWSPQSAGSKAFKFQLCYSIAKCCFSGPPKVQHFVDSHVKDMGKVEVSDNLVRVVGTLHVKVEHDGGKVSSVYQMDVDSIEPKG